VANPLARPARPVGRQGVSEVFPPPASRGIEPGSSGPGTPVPPPSPRKAAAALALQQAGIPDRAKQQGHRCRSFRPGSSCSTARATVLLAATGGPTKASRSPGFQGQIRGHSSTAGPARSPHARPLRLRVSAHQAVDLSAPGRRCGGGHGLGNGANAGGPAWRGLEHTMTKHLI